jgi:hypothetical protein
VSPENPQVKKVLLSDGYRITKRMVAVFREKQKID